MLTEFACNVLQVSSWLAQSSSNTEAWLKNLCKADLCHSISLHVQLRLIYSLDVQRYAFSLKSSRASAREPRQELTKVTRVSSPVGLGVPDWSGMVGRVEHQGAPAYR